jgi:hypothetical protein
LRAAYPCRQPRAALFQGEHAVCLPSFPLTEVHLHAELAAEFAGEAELFWNMHDALFANRSRLSIPAIFLIGEELRLPETAMRYAPETGQFRNASSETRCATISWAASAAAEWYPDLLCQWRKARWRLRPYFPSISPCCGHGRSTPVNDGGPAGAAFQRFSVN